ncbi:hypothetical protein PENTCL1PPCAC_7456, partial [Pristionchus entomophagus]
NLTCNIITGLFSNEKGIEVANKSTVFCEIVDTSTDAPPSSASVISKDTLVTIAVGGGILLLVLAILIPSLVLIFKRKRRHAEAERIRNREEKRR